MTFDTASIARSDVPPPYTLEPPTTSPHSGAQNQSWDSSGRVGPNPNSARYPLSQGRARSSSSLQNPGLPSYSYTGSAQHERTPLNPSQHQGYAYTSYSVSVREVPSRWTSFYRFMIMVLVIAVIYQMHEHRQTLSQYPPTLAEREAIRREWEAERVTYDTEVGRVRRSWALERVEHDRESEDMRRESEQWEQEKDGWKYDKIEAGRRLGLHWDQVQARRCVAFGTREYVARMEFEPREACDVMPVNIGGRMVDSPGFCENTRWDGDIVAHWFVDKDEGCMPHWGRVYDKGCVAPGLHRWETRLWGLHYGEDWHAMCKSTPADVAGRHFDGPTYCQNRGIFFGMVGMFHGTDLTCP